MSYTAEQEAIMAEVKRLTVAINAAIEARTSYMDANMEKFTNVKPGEDIYDINSGRRLGKVSGLYRYWGGNPEYDTSMDINVRYEISPHCYDNTSRQIGLRWGSKQEAMDQARRTAERLARGG